MSDKLKKTKKALSISEEYIKTDNHGSFTIVCDNCGNDECAFSLIYGRECFYCPKCEAKEIFSQHIRR